MQQLTQYQVDHLFVLVGTNPLPCLVAGRLLGKEGGTIHLVYSAETTRCASGLADALGANLLRDGVALAGQARDAREVYTRVAAKVRSITGGSVGLHYTGGTKVMSVHAYRAVLAHASGAICSYLDSDQLAIYCERDGEQLAPPLRLLAKDMQRAIGLTLHDLWRIHGIEPLPTRHREYSERSAPFFRLAPPLLAARFIAGGRQQWLDRLRDAKPDDPLTSLPFPEVVKAFQEEQPALTTYGDLCGFFGSRAGNWLRGGDWLEDLVLMHLSGLSEELALKGVICSAATERPNPKDASKIDRGFELDVVALRGYQLFVFSCYIGQNGDTCKSKLFEAAHRAHQLGGGEARFALVCGHPDRNHVRQQLAGLLPEDAYEVFGLSDWPDLRGKLCEWIRRVDREHG